MTHNIGNKRKYSEETDNEYDDIHLQKKMKNSENIHYCDNKWINFLRLIVNSDCLVCQFTHFGYNNELQHHLIFTFNYICSQYLSQ
jgi:hypothetical protein